MTQTLELKANRNSERVEAIYRIPVVVHVVHSGEAIGTGKNVSKDRIKGQIDLLTKDFRRRNVDASNTPARFLPVASDAKIEFVLAKQDPGGNPTDGIVRIRGPKAAYHPSSDRDLLRSLSYWSPQRYLNIFVTALSSRHLGSASYPVAPLGVEGIETEPGDFILDGVLIDHRYFGVNRSSPSFTSLGRTTTHEVGHYLGLRHIWGDGDCNKDDFVEDTPPANGNNQGLGSPCTFPNPDDHEVCIPGRDEMFMNYMDYTDDVCMNLFTNGQKERMRAVLEQSPRRASLRSSPGLSEPQKVANDLAIRRVRSLSPSSCNPSFSPSIEIANYGINTIRSYTVSISIDGLEHSLDQPVASLAPLQSEVVFFPDVTIDSSPVQVVFSVKNVNGEADGDSDNSTVTHVLNHHSPVTLPFTANFEHSVNLIGAYGNTFPWQQVTAPGDRSTNKALSFKAYRNTSWFGDETMIKTPVFDFRGREAIGMTFRYAYAQTTHPDFHDGLSLVVSTDCGRTFIPPTPRCSINTAPT